MDNETDGYTQAEALAKDLRMSCNFIQAHQDKVQGNAILSRYTVTHVQQIELPSGSEKRDDGSRMPGSKERRMALVARVAPS